MSRDYRLYIDDILESINKIKKYIGFLSFKEFMDNSLLIDAVLRNLEIISEATRNIPEELLNKHQNINWKKLKGFRNVAAHRYFDMKLELVWDLLENKLSELKSACLLILEELNKTEKR